MRQQLKRNTSFIFCLLSTELTTDTREDEEIVNDCLSLLVGAGNAAKDITFLDFLADFCKKNTKVKHLYSGSQKSRQARKE